MSLEPKHEPLWGPAIPRLIGRVRDRWKTLLAAGFIAAIGIHLVSDLMEIPTTVVLKDNCDLPPAYSLVTKVYGRQFWAAQLTAIEDERRRLEMWPQFLAQMKREIADRELELKRTNRPARTFAEECPELMRRAAARYNLPPEPCPPITEEMLREQRMRNELEQVRRDAQQREDAIVSAYREENLEQMRRNRLTWLDKCEHNVKTAILKAQSRQ